MNDVDLAAQIREIRLEAERVERIAKIERYRKIDKYKPYWWQKEFHEAGANFTQRMIRAANRTGKTMSAANEAAYHATGEYPFWWTGRRLNKPNLGWVATITNELGRDVQQKELLGAIDGEELGTGSIPRENIIKVTKRQAGIGDVADVITIRHKSGGESKIVCKAYEQGWQKFQGAAPDWWWLDEEAVDFKIYTECVTRIMTTNGFGMVTFTPLIGQTALVKHFVDNDRKNGVWMITASWEDAPHLTEKMKSEMMATYPRHERDARTKGVPLMGSGRVFPVNEDEIVISPFEIPPHFARIVGVDFGTDHPFGAAWWAIDRDQDIVYLTDCYKKQWFGEESPTATHVAAIKSRGDCPVSWPHDGMNRGKADGSQLHKAYRRAGLTSMLARSACYDDKKLGAQPVEPIVLEMIDRMETGRLKVFPQCKEWLEEFRNLHRDDNGKIVARNDDVMKASMYGLMMKRRARPAIMGRRKAVYDRPMVA